MNFEATEFLWLGMDFGDNKIDKILNGCNDIVTFALKCHLFLGLFLDE